MPLATDFRELHATTSWNYAIKNGNANGERERERGEKKEIE